MTKDLAAKENKNLRFETFFPPIPDSSSLLVGCLRSDYSASRIARAVEDADASLINLNVTSLDSREAAVVVALRVDHRDPSRVVRSLERYGYSILSVEDAGLSDDTLRRRYEELMKYINM